MPGLEFAYLDAVADRMAARFRCAEVLLMPIRSGPPPLGAFPAERGDLTGHLELAPIAAVFGVSGRPAPFAGPGAAA